MQCYEDDDIFIFGFSRGAYVARFLAEMLDHVGLLSAGNQEMARFAWKAFAQWQEREDNTAEEKRKKREMLDFLQAFRDTFSRPVRRIRFLGLFDTGMNMHAIEVMPVIYHICSQQCTKIRECLDEKEQVSLVSHSWATVGMTQLTPYQHCQELRKGDQTRCQYRRTKSQVQI